MDNFRNPMYARNRNMGNYHKTPPPSGCGATPVIEACPKERCDDDYLAKCVDKLPLAMAYVPFQKWRNVTDAATGLQQGTIFNELFKPFYGDKNCFGMRGDRS